MRRFVLSSFPLILDHRLHAAPPDLLLHAIEPLRVAKLLDDGADAVLRVERIDFERLGHLLDSLQTGSRRPLVSSLMLGSLRLSSTATSRSVSPWSPPSRLSDSPNLDTFPPSVEGTSGQKSLGAYTGWAHVSARTKRTSRRSSACSHAGTRPPRSPGLFPSHGTAHAIANVGIG